MQFASLTSWFWFRRITLTSEMGPQLLWPCRTRSPELTSTSAPAAQICPVRTHAHTHTHKVNSSSLTWGCLPLNYKISYFHPNDLLLSVCFNIYSWPLLEFKSDLRKPLNNTNYLLWVSAHQPGRRKRGSGRRCPQTLDTSFELPNPPVAAPWTQEWQKEKVNVAKKTDNWK